MMTLELEGMTSQSTITLPGFFFTSVAVPFVGGCKRLKFFFSIVCSSNIYSITVGETLSVWRNNVLLQNRHFSASHDYKLSIIKNIQLYTRDNMHTI